MLLSLYPPNASISISPQNVFLYIPPSLWEGLGEGLKEDLKEGLKEGLIESLIEGPMERELGKNWRNLLSYTI